MVVLPNVSFFASWMSVAADARDRRQGAHSRMVASSCSDK